PRRRRGEAERVDGALGARAVVGEGAVAARAPSHLFVPRPRDTASGPPFADLRAGGARHAHPRLHVDRPHDRQGEHADPRRDRETNHSGLTYSTPTSSFALTTGDCQPATNALAVGK